ncbi:hypothetical protein FE257_000255 [Aspergillus nanangensis]|uniref:Uncharacterized protein n=1 Tax=Aspergillus nanangensis TaxID=2582783 RepID=A0AAD4CZ17_ASPNN|nr:hypothetical protein FE257_000255 [Aspergillus nanangensis]
MAEDKTQRAMPCTWPRVLFCFDQAWFISFWALAGCLMAAAKGLWWSAHQRPEVFDPPYSPYFRAGVTLPYATSWIFVLWSSLSLIPHWAWWYKKRGYYLILAAIRLGIAVLVTAAVVVQSYYLPLPLGKCEYPYYLMWREYDHDDPRIQGKSTIWKLLPEIASQAKYEMVYFTPCEMHARILWNMEIFIACWMFLTAVSAVVIYFTWSRAKSPEAASPPIVQDMHRVENSTSGFLRHLLAPRMRYRAACKHQNGSLKQRRRPGGSGLWGLSVLRTRGFTPLNGDNAHYEMGEWPPSVDGTQPRECPCYGKTNKDNRCWGCQIQTCHDCRIVTSRRRPTRPHQGCKVLCGSCFYERCCETQVKLPWKQPVTCVHFDNEKQSKSDDDMLVDLSLCRNFCANLSKEMLFDLREIKERNGAAEPFLAVLECHRCKASCLNGKERWDYFFTCPICDKFCNSDVHQCK